MTTMMLGEQGHCTAELQGIKRVRVKNELRLADTELRREFDTEPEKLIQVLPKGMRQSSVHFTNDFDSGQRVNCMKTRKVWRN